MVTFMDVLIVVLALATLAMMVTAVVLAVQALAVHRHIQAVREEVMPRVGASRSLFTRLAGRMLGVKSMLEMEWRRVQPRVNELKADVQKTVTYWKRSADRAASVARKPKWEVHVNTIIESKPLRRPPLSAQ